MNTDTVLLTPQNNWVHLHARDEIRAVRIEKLVWETELTVAHYPALTLAVIDEANLMLWSDELHPMVAHPDEPRLAIVERTFAVWDSLTIGINTLQEPLDFCIRLYYTINPE